MLILMGPSASGKTEVAKILFKKYGLKKVITTTTRSMRTHEINDVDYHFVSKDKFLKMIEENKFLEYTCYNNNFYGTTKDEVGDDKCVILEPHGAKKLKDINPSFFVIYFYCTPEIRKKRMLVRGDSKENISARIKVDDEAFSEDKVSFADIKLESETISVEDLSDEVYQIYQNYLKNK